MTGELELRLAAVTDVGRTRHHNEDCYLMWNLARGERIPGDGPTVTQSTAEGILVGVYDGMGGAAAGEEASRLAAQSFADRAAEADLERLGSLEDTDVWLTEGVRAADARILERARANPEMEGMGSTCTTVVARDGELTLAHVGDSRAYHLRMGTLRQISVDHSYVAQLVALGRLTHEQARHHPQRNVLVQVLGLGRELDVDRVRVVLEPDDGLLLCSDGLCDLVRDEELRRELQEHSDPADACDRLVDLANARGGIDNITVVVARVGGPEQLR